MDPQVWSDSSEHQRPSSPLAGLAAKLSQPQPEERERELLEAVVKHASVEDVRALALDEDQSLHLRVAMARVLAGLAHGTRRDAAVDALLEMLASEHPGVRVAAVEALGVLEAPAPAVLARLGALVKNDVNPSVREVARITLADMGSWE
jgi:HEAT repeat protein